MLKKSKLDGHQSEINQLIRLGVPKITIAKQFGVNPSTLYHWINKGNLVQDNQEELTKQADEASLRIITSISNELYRLCSREMQDLEHEGVWIGNGHHAANKIHAEVMESIEPMLEATVRAMILR